MKRRIIMLGAALIVAAAIPGRSQTTSSDEINSDGASSGIVVRIEKLEPFIHKTHILADSDVKSIRFVGLKRVKVATELKSTLDAEFCENDNRSSDAGFSSCSVVEPIAYEPAYQVSYSYTGPPLSSDEYASRRFEFSVLFRPEELDGADPDSFARNKRRAAESLEVTTSRETRKGFVIDEKASTFCPGFYADAEWRYEDPACQDKIVVRAVTIPSDYVTVSVEPVLPTRAAVPEQ